MSKYLFCALAYMIQSSMGMAMETDKDGAASTSLSSSVSFSSTSCDSDSEAVELESDESEVLNLSPKYRMEKYLKAWEKGPSSAIPSNLFDEVYKSSDMSSLEKVGLVFFQNRLTPSNQIPHHRIAHLLGREFTDFYKPSYGLVAFKTFIGSAIGTFIGAFGGGFIMVCSTPAIGFGTGIPLGCVLGTGIGGGIGYCDLPKEWNVSEAPIPSSVPESSTWISNNRSEHYRLYQQKVTDALYANFNVQEPNTFEILKACLLDINGALPITKMTKNLPEEKKLSLFIDPQDIRKFKISKKDENLTVEFYAYGHSSIQNTANLVHYLENQPASVIRSVYRIFESLVDHKNFYAYTKTQTQIFAYTAPKMIEKQA